MSSRGNRLVEPLLRHGMPADAAEKQALGSVPRLQRSHQLRAELVAGFLARHDPDRQRRVSHEAGPSTAVRPRRETARVGRPCARVFSWSSTRVEPAPTAMPERPARAASVTVRGPMAGMSTRRSCPRLAALIRTPPSFAPAQAEQRSAHGRHPAQHAVGSLRPLDRQHMLARHDGRLADIEGRERAQQFEPEGNRLRSSSGGRRVPVMVARRDKAGRELVRADHLVATLLEKHHGAAQDLVVPPGDHFADLLPVAQERIGPEQRGEAGAADGAHQGNRAGPPFFEPSA